MIIAMWTGELPQLPPRTPRSRFSAHQSGSSITTKGSLRWRCGPGLMTKRVRIGDGVVLCSSCRSLRRCRVLLGLGTLQGRAGARRGVLLPTVDGHLEPDRGLLVGQPGCGRQREVG